MSSNEFNLMPSDSPETKPDPAGAAAETPAKPDKPRSVADDWARLTKRLGKGWSRLTGRSGKSSGLLATDLIKSEVVTYFDWQKNLTTLAVLLAIDFLFIFAGYKGVEFWQRQKEAEVQAAISRFNELQAEKRLAEVGLDEIVNFQRQLDQIAFVLERHIHWTNFFEFLEETTLASVYYGQFSGSTDGKYVLNATGKNFYEIKEQMMLFRANPYVISAETQGASSNARESSGTVSYSIDLKVRDSVFTDGN